MHEKNLIKLFTQRLYVFLYACYRRISISMRIGQHICIITYTSCTMHIFIFSHRTIRLEKNNSIKKSHLSLNKAIPSLNESCRAVWKFLFGSLWYKNSSFRLLIIREKERYFPLAFIFLCLKAYLTLSETIFNHENLISNKASIKTSFHLSKQSKTQFTYYANLCCFGCAPRKDCFFL